MNFKNYFLFLFLFSQLIFSQNGFQFDASINKVTVPFNLINNLVIIPLEVNGVTLNFLLDTGVEETILFSLDESDEIIFSQIEKIKIRGFGKKEPFDGFKSTNNKVKLKNFVDNNHTMYLVLDQDINISSQIGVPVNGIIGYHFFKNHLVKINYSNNKLTVYNSKQKVISKIDKTFSKVSMQLSNGKPYITTPIICDDTNEVLNAKLLIDTGSSESLWLFKTKTNNVKIPKINFADFLGRGFSGDVFGIRGRIKSVSIGNYKVLNPLIAFPDSIAIKDFEGIDSRFGSVGSEIMKRFTVYFDYQSSNLYLKKNNKFSNPFNFNMSGLEIEHQGLQWTQQSYEENPALANNLFDANGDKVASNLKYKFELKPIYIISNVRKESAADLAGLLKGDIIVKLNKREGYNFTLQEINDLLKSEDGELILIEVERAGKIIKLKFQLKSII